MYDGSGIQMRHLTFDTVAPTIYKTGSNGNNNITTAPASFSMNDLPTSYASNFCLTMDLQLSGTTDTSALDTAVSAYTDGYKGVSTIGLEQVLGGALGGWRGVCMVFYTSKYVMDATSGAVCHAVVSSSATGAGPFDFGASSLMHVPSATWAPPAASGSVSPVSQALSDAKYAIVHEPAAAVAHLMNEGYYASATWYQPKLASSYTTIARYGKGDFVAAYCFQGAGSTTYFQAPA